MPNSTLPDADRAAVVPSAVLFSRHATNSNATSGGIEGRAQEELGNDVRAHDLCRRFTEWTAGYHLAIVASVRRSSSRSSGPNGLTLTGADRTVVSPFETNWERRPGYMFGFGGCAWQFILTREPLEAWNHQWILMEDGRIGMTAVDMSDLGAIDRTFRANMQLAEERGWRKPWER